MISTPIVIEKDANGERSYDIYSRLLKDRIILLDGPIHSELHTAARITAQFLFLDKESDKQIMFYINSPGGMVSEALAMYDTMQYVSSPVYTVVYGQACSAGSLLAQAGEPGHRYILPNAVHMIHQPSGGYSGQATDIEIHAKEILRLKERLTDIYHIHTKQPMDTLRNDMERDHYFPAEECVQYGLADQIIKSSKDV